MNTLHFDKFWAWFFAILWWPFWKWRLVEILRCWESIQNIIIYLHTNFIPPLYEKSGGYIAITLSVRPSVCPSVHTFVTLRYLSFYWKKWFYIWYMALAWWFVLCLPFPGLTHIYFLFTVRLRIFHVCCNENFRNSYLSFYWKKWFYIWYMALAWWLVLCLPFPGLPHIYFLFTVRLTNERVGVFLARRSVQHLVWLCVCFNFDKN
jgi:hypothetical protein